MNWKKKHAKLRERVYKASGAKSLSAFDKQVTRAAKGLTAEEALFVLADKCNVKTSREFANLSSGSQQRVSDRVIRNSSRIRSTTPTSTDSTRTNHVSRTETLTASSRYIDLLEVIQDDELRDRCADLIKRPRNHDRVFREATTILEHRIKTLSGITRRMNPQDLISKAVSPNPARAILVVSNDTSEQEGFFKICSGIEAAFRNRTHHEVSNKLTRYDAIKFCGFIDSLLLILASAEVHQERIWYVLPNKKIRRVFKITLWPIRQAHDKPNNFNYHWNYK